MTFQDHDSFPACRQVVCVGETRSGCGLDRPVQSTKDVRAAGWSASIVDARQTTKDVQRWWNQCAGTYVHPSYTSSLPDQVTNGFCPA